MKLSGSDKSLKIVAYTITIFFAFAILFPLFFTFTTSLKDNAKIYDMPIRFIPEQAKSISIVIDYSNYKSSSDEALLEVLKKDLVLSMFPTIYELDQDSIFEVKFYGTLEDKVIFYARSHKLKLELERDFGVYAQSTVTPEVLLFEDRYNRAANSIGYTFNRDGISKLVEKTSDNVNPFDGIIKEFLTNKYSINGNYINSTVQTKPSLLLENFIYYLQMPSYAYAKNTIIHTFSFFAFLLNTLIVIGWAILTQVMLCSLTAYPISRLLPPKIGKPVLFYFIATMMIPFSSIMLPQFIMFKSMHFYNNYRALLMPFLLPFGFYVFLFKGFFDKLPNSLFEAAKIDGSSNFYCYIKICLPLSKPIISVIALQTFLSNWNDFFWSWMVTEKQNLWTLNVALFNLSRNSSTKQTFILGLSILTILPVILLTILFSSQIKENLASSGIKG